MADRTEANLKGDTRKNKNTLGGPPLDDPRITGGI